MCLDSRMNEPWLLSEMWKAFGVVAHEAGVGTVHYEENTGTRFSLSGFASHSQHPFPYLAHLQVLTNI